jgi:hypothetical protein
MRTTWLFNPFKFIAGWKALVVGWAIMLLTAGIAFLGKTHFNGVIDAHTGIPAPFFIFVLDGFIAWALTVIFFYGSALLFSGSSTRLIDVAGTMALARAPMLIVAFLFLAMPPLKDIRQIRDIHDIDSMVLFISLGALVFTIWMIALMYHAFTVSTNMKGRKAIWVFIVTLVIAEIASQFIFYPLYQYISSSHG